jgi:hypothetical protein
MTTRIRPRIQLGPIWARGGGSIGVEPNFQLHALDGRRQRFVDHLFIGLAVSYAPDVPIRSVTRFRGRAFDDHRDEIFAARRGRPDGFRKRQLELRDRHRNPLVGVPPIRLEQAQALFPRRYRRTPRRGCRSRRGCRFLRGYSSWRGRRSLRGCISRRPPEDSCLQHGPRYRGSDIARGNSNRTTAGVLAGHIV